MKKNYLKPELEVLDVELESMIAATGGSQSSVDDPSHPGGKTPNPFGESREFTDF